MNVLLRQVHAPRPSQITLAMSIMALFALSACTAKPTELAVDKATASAETGSPSPAPGESEQGSGDMVVGTSVIPKESPDAPRPPAAELDGIPVGFTEQGHPYRGSPDAPLTVEEFSDYHCPFCMRFATQVQPTLLQEYVAKGKVRFVFREYPIVSLHPNAAKVSVAAQCVAEQGAEGYWKVHNALYAQQSASSSAVDIDAYLAELVESQGVDPDGYKACIASGDQLADVQAGVDAAQALGFNGTPSFRISVADSDDVYELIGARPVEIYRQWFDALLAGNAPPVEPTAVPPELPFWASDAGLAPDPKRPGATLAGDPFEGQPDAPLTVVEFTDFQCPPCREYGLEAHPAVVKAVVDSGRVRWVVKNRPLPEHPQSALAAAAGECALEQGRYGAMYTALFETVDRWAVDEPEAALEEVAQEAGLDADDFRACLTGRAAMEAVLTDVLDAEGLAQTTPTFIVIQGGKGSVLRGKKSAEEMIDLLEGWILDDLQ